jgi:hypothetical protein
MLQVWIIGSKQQSVMQEQLVWTICPPNNALPRNLPVVLAYALLLADALQVADIFERRNKYCWGMSNMEGQFQVA